MLTGGRLTHLSAFVLCPQKRNTDPPLGIVLSLTIRPVESRKRSGQPLSQKRLSRSWSQTGGFPQISLRPDFQFQAKTLSRRRHCQPDHTRTTAGYWGGGSH